MRNFLGFFFLANAPASDKKDLLSEVDVMKKLKPHPHVIKLLGCVTETGKGCLKEILQGFKENEIIMWSNRIYTDTEGTIESVLPEGFLSPGTKQTVRNMQ